MRVVQILLPYAAAVDVFVARAVVLLPDNDRRERLALRKEAVSKEGRGAIREGERWERKKGLVWRRARGERVG